jgi:hypothetical protein
MTRPSHSSWLDHPNIIRSVVEIIQLIIM